MPNPVLATASDVAGRTLSTLTAGLATLRSADKPLHPDGTMYAARLVRTGSTDAIGVPWLEQPGEDEVLVRISKGMGLPRPLPDVLGLALRLRRGQTRYSDLLLATTGWDPVTRHVLLPRWSAERPLTTLLPYRSPSGPIVIGARPTGGGTYGFWWAPVGRRWRTLGTLALGEELEPDHVVSFDPVLNPLPGLAQYGWVERLRERSYATARAERGD